MRIYLRDARNAGENGRAIFYDFARLRRSIVHRRGIIRHGEYDWCVCVCMTHARVRTMRERPW